MGEHSGKVVGAIFAFLAVIFTLTSLFLYIHDEKLDYYLYLYGDDIRTTPRLLIRIMSKDGYIVPDALITADGRPVEGVLLDVSKPVRELSFTVGGREYRYELDFGRLFEEGAKRLPDDWLTGKELDNGRETVKRMATEARRLYILPDTMRMFGELENRVTLFCFTATGPCDDPSITIDDVAIPLENGVGTGAIFLPIRNETDAFFPDGTAATVLFPYTGRMFSLAEEGDRLVLRTLVEARNVHIDCWRAGIWQFTDVVTGKPEGVKLPVHYAACDRVQVSFDSRDPNGNFLVRSSETAGIADIADPYYQALLDDLRKYRPELIAKLLARYPAIRFHRLNTIYTGADFEKVLAARKETKLTIVWWMILLTAVAGITLFALFSYRRFSVVESDEEGEFVTLSVRQQKWAVLALSAGLALFFVLLLSVLGNLA